MSKLADKNRKTHLKPVGSIPTEFCKEFTKPPGKQGTVWGMFTVRPCKKQVKVLRFPPSLPRAG